MSVRDLYAVLGVPRHASNAAIRRAYKDHVLRVHPDKQPEGHLREAAEARFKEICSAYEVLSDSRARAHHDALIPSLPSLSSVSSNASMGNTTPTTNANATSGSSANPFESEDFKRNFAADFEKKMRSDGETLDTEELFSAMFGERRANFKMDMRPKAEDKHLPLTLSLEDLHLGCVKRRKLQRTIQDRSSGEYVQTTSVLRIDVKPGYRPGDRIRFKDAGSESDTFKAPDVVFIIEQKNHPKFMRQGDDLILPLNISLQESLTGVNQVLVGIDGEEVLFALENVAKPGETHVIENMGLSKRGQPGVRGNMVVKFVVEFPDRLLPAEKKAIKDVLVKVEARNTPPPPKQQMRRTASMFAARAREFSDVTAHHEPTSTSTTQEHAEPKSTGRRAFRDSAPAGTTSNSSHGNGNASNSSLPTNGNGNGNMHHFALGKRASTATPLRSSRDRRPSVRVSRDRKHALRKESNAPVPAGLSGLSNISRKNSEAVKEMAAAEKKLQQQHNGNSGGIANGMNGSAHRKRNKKSWLGGLFR